MELVFDAPPGLVMTADVPPYPPKRKRMKTKWTDTAPTYLNDATVLPRAICLSPLLSVADLVRAATNPHRLYTCTAFSPQDWLDKSGILRTLARNHPLYPIVVRGDNNRSKRCPHAALRRLEHIVQWQWEVIDRDGIEHATAVVGRQIRHGLSRLKTRRWTRTPPASRHVYTLPPTDLPAVLAHAVYSLDDALDIGGQRTMRVYDVTGDELWLLPASTLNMLMTVPAPATPVDPGDHDVLEGEGTPFSL